MSAREHAIRFTVGFVCIASFVCAQPSVLQAQDAGDPAEFLKEAHEKYVDLTQKGLKSFAAEFRLDASGDKIPEKLKEQMYFGYSWTAPDKEEYSFSKVLAKLEKTLQEATRGMWQDITGVLVFENLGKASGLKLAFEEETAVLTGSLEGLGAFTARFEKSTHLLQEILFDKDALKVVYAFEKEGGLFRLVSKEVFKGDKRAAKTAYSLLQKVNGFVLPCAMSIEGEKGPTKLAINYMKVNDTDAAVAAPEAADVKAKVSKFEKAWPKWSADEKTTQMKELAGVADDMASAAIALRGLVDADLGVRKEAAMCLAKMKRRNATKPLLAALDANDKNFDVYIAVIYALGEIADPAAVDALSKDWWNQKFGENAVAAASAKCAALGKIRHPSAVDALIDTFFLTNENAPGLALIRASIIASLKKLTGQNFGYDRDAWKDWWKKNRTTFKFE